MTGLVYSFPALPEEYEYEDTNRSAATAAPPPPPLPHREAACMRGHEGAVLAVRFTSNGNYCLSCGKVRGGGGGGG